MNPIKLQDTKRNDKIQQYLHYIPRTCYSEKKSTKQKYKIASKHKIFRNKLMEVKEKYNKNCIILTKQIKEDINKWKDVVCAWTERILQLKCLQYPK